MSAFSDFLTHATAPWWTPLAGTVVGGLITFGSTRSNDIRKDNRQTTERMNQELRELCARFQAEVMSVFLKATDASGLEKLVAQAVARVDAGEISMDEFESVMNRIRPTMAPAIVKRMLEPFLPPVTALPLTLGDNVDMLRPLMQAIAGLRTIAPTEIDQAAERLYVALVCLAHPDRAGSDPQDDLDNCRREQLKFTNAVRTYFGREPITAPEGMAIGMIRTSTVETK